jgi:hypothetical protein
MATSIQTVSDWKKLFLVKTPEQRAEVIKFWKDKEAGFLADHFALYNWELKTIENMKFAISELELTA